MNRFTQSINRRRTARYKVWPAPSVRLRRIGIVSADPCIKILPILAKTACRGSGIFEFNSRYGSENIRLPNITGYLNAANLGNVPVEFAAPGVGALKEGRYSIGRAVPDIEQSIQKIVNDFSFNAAQSSAIYGGATTVQTASLRAYTLIRYA